MSQSALATAVLLRSGPDHFARAILNILEDVEEDRERIDDTQRATLNILDDFAQERSELESTRRALLNILDDLDFEREKLDQVNRELTRENEERRHVQAELVVKATDLERSNLDLSQFAYVASHDLQEPLRHISSYVQKLAREYTGVFDERGRRWIGYVVDGSARMEQLINGLLEFSRVERSLPALRPIDLATVATAAVRAVSARTDEVGGSVSVAALPSVLGDEDLLYRLLLNLVSNAVKFARPGCAPRVAITAEPQGGGRWVVAVADNGIGIEACYRERAFEIFERLNGNDFPGTGIGLSVARRIVEAHGGTITLDETAGGGTTVRFTLQGAVRDER